MHPLIENLSSLKDVEIENKINDLTRKYFQTHNYEVQSQISLILDTYKEELSVRRVNEWKKIMEEKNKDLDKLIKIN